MMCHKAGILAAILIFVFLLADSMTTEGKCVVFIIFALVATSVFLSRFTLAMLNNFSAIRIEEAVRRKEGNGT
jgi:NhaP-type Na+/H+ or K+/H+ antiporter